MRSFLATTGTRMSFIAALLVTLALHPRLTIAVKFASENAGLLEIPFGQVPTNSVIINVRWNLIHHVEFCPPLPFLNRMLLGENRITEFPNLVNVSDSLVSLILKRNLLTFIKPERLRALVNLEELDVRNNYLTSFPDMSPKTGSSLLSLAIGENNFSKWPHLPVIGRKLETLISTANNFGTPSRPELKVFPSLTFWLCANCGMEELPDVRAFPKTHAAFKLDLKNNALTRLSSVSLSYMDDLRWEVVLNHNQISALPNMMARPIAAAVDLTGNPFACDCHSKWLKVTPSGVNVSSIICNSPPEVSQRLFSNLHFRELSCEGSTRTTSISAFDISVVTKRMPPINDVIKVTDRMDCATRCLSEDACLVFAFRITPGGPECALTDALDMTNGVRGAPSGEWGNSDVRWYLTDT